MVKNAISIEPYFDPEVPNMGFEKYNMSTAPGSEITEYISMDSNGRFMTGLDEDSIILNRMEDEDEKKAVIKEIREVVKRLERTYGPGALDARTGIMWSNFFVKIGHTGISLDRLNPKDEILYYAIKAGGFDSIAPNLEAARAGDYKFYLSQLEKDSNLKVESIKIVNRAKAALTDLDETDSYKMVLVAKVVLAPSNEFSESTPNGIVYEKLHQFIDGKIVKDNRRNTVKQFLEAYKKDVETLSLEALVRDALYFNFITKESDGYLYNKQTETRLGKNEKEIVKHLQAPINQLEYENLKSRVDAKFNK